AWEATVSENLKILAVVSAAAAALILLGPAVALADTDGITVHCVGLVVTNAAACTGPSADSHLTIQDAVNHAEPEETVFVGTGTFPEQVVITEPLTLEGDGAALTSIQPVMVAANTTSLFSGAPIAAIL